VQIWELVLESHFHVAVLYANVKLKEQEIRNLVWVSEFAFSSNQRTMNQFLLCFAMTLPGLSRRGKEYRVESSS
jgi:hypothetical protein